MIVILPYCKADHKDAICCIKSLSRMADLAAKRGLPVAGGHSLILMPTERIPMEDEEVLVSQSRGCEDFQSVETKQLHIDREWPYVVNWAFMEAMKLQRVLDEPMLWCEPDVTFVGYHPLDRLEAAFNRSGMDMMGTLSQRAGLGLSINGVAVYGRTASRIFNDVSLTSCDMEFDLWLRHNYLHRAYGTDLIGQVARTRQLTDDDMSGFTGKSLKDRIGRDKVMWHGYKDGCLFDRLSKYPIVSPWSAQLIASSGDEEESS